MPTEKNIADNPKDAITGAPNAAIAEPFMEWKKFTIPPAEAFLIEAQLAETDKVDYVMGDVVIAVLPGTRTDGSAYSTKSVLACTADPAT